MFDCWQLLSLTPLLPPLLPHVCAIKPGCFLLCHLWEIQTACRTITLALPPNHHKTPKPVSSLYSLRPFLDLLGSCPAFHRKPHYGNNKVFHIPLVCVWLHQSQHLSWILGGESTFSQCGCPQQNNILLHSPSSALFFFIALVPPDIICICLPLLYKWLNDRSQHLVKYLS